MAVELPFSRRVPALTVVNAPIPPTVRAPPETVATDAAPVTVTAPPVRRRGLQRARLNGAGADVGIEEPAAKTIPPEIPPLILALLANRV
jgi:hypothetical protein